MITEVFGKGTISTPNSPWNHGLKKQIGYGTCDERSRDTEEIQDVLGLSILAELPSTLRVAVGGPMVNGDHAISSVSEINPREQPRFAGRLVDRAPRLAGFDNLTTLHNRMALREKLGNSARDAEALGQSAALILLDLDDFNDVNDTYGQAAGDACLQHVASRLIATVGAVGFLARMGGDEFALLLQGHTRQSLSHILKGIQEALALPFSFEGHIFHLTSSIGIAVRCDGRRFNPDELIRDAALALDEAKASGKSCHRVFRRVLRTTCNEKLETLRGVRSALATGQLELYYQSKITLRDRTHSGFEALLRWNKGDGQVLPPGSFVSAFDDPSLSMEIGNYVIASAIGQARRWMIARVPFVSIAINLSASQFRDDQLGNRILNAIAATNVDPRMIEVEVTEGVFLSATSDAVLNACKVLKQGGVRIAFDDFGTGFASLTHLRDFPVDIIKIDRSFINRLGQGQNTTTIVNAMVGLAHNLSMSIVAEGVETQAQAEFLKAIGCDAAQGYLFARPVPAAVAAQQLQYPHRLPDFGCTPSSQP
jgi:diguanylate cyclase (GGDEF)-like protein